MNYEIKTIINSSNARFKEKIKKLNEQGIVI